jgi:hypothetical protein
MRHKPVNQSSASPQEMQHKQYKAYDQGNVNETSGYAKREIPKQPKNNQNSGDYSKHIFISTRLYAKKSAITFSRAARMFH